MGIIGRMNDDFTFETCEQKTADDVRRERVITIIVFLILVLFGFGTPTIINIGKALFYVEPIIY